MKNDLDQHLVGTWCSCRVNVRIMAVNSAKEQQCRTAWPSMLQCIISCMYFADRNVQKKKTSQDAKIYSEYSKSKVIASGVAFFPFNVRMRSLDPARGQRSGLGQRQDFHKTLSLVFCTSLNPSVHVSIRDPCYSNGIDPSLCCLSPPVHVWFCCSD